MPKDKEKRKALIVEIIKRRGSKALPERKLKEKEDDFGFKKAKKNILKNLGF